jgi:hypothetical protein
LWTVAFLLVRASLALHLLLCNNIVQTSLRVGRKQQARHQEL